MTVWSDAAGRRWWAVRHPDAEVEYEVRRDGTSYVVTHRRVERLHQGDVDWLDKLRDDRRIT